MSADSCQHRGLLGTWGKPLHSVTLWLYIPCHGDVTVESRAIGSRWGLANFSQAVGHGACGHVGQATRVIGMEWAKTRMSNPWKCQKFRLDSHPETGRSGADLLPVFSPASDHVTWRPNQVGLTQRLDSLSMLMMHLSSLNLQPITFSHPGYSHTLSLKLHNLE